MRRESWVDAEDVALQIEAGEAENYRLPETSQSGDPYAAGTIRVQFKVLGRGLAQKTKSGFGFAESCRDQRVDTRAQRTAMGTAWLVVAEIGFRRRARELVRQQRDQRHHIGLLHHLRPLRSLAADLHVDRHLAVGVQRQIERFQLVKSGKLLVEPGDRIETGNDALKRVAPVRKFGLTQRELFQ